MKVNNQSDKTWQESMKSYRCKYDCERKALGLERELDDANAKVATLTIMGAISQPKHRK
jgi:hypothetical protein